MMKKYAGKVLAATMAVSMMVPGVNVLAADGATESTTNSNSTTLKYSVTESYKWTVPTEITFEGDAGINQTRAVNGSVAVTDNIIKSGQRLKIAIAESEKFKIETQEGAELTYSVKKKDGSDSLNGGGEILSVQAGTKTGSQDLTYTLTTSTGAAEVAGEYTGTLNYEASIN